MPSTEETTDVDKSSAAKENEFSETRVNRDFLSSFLIVSLGCACIYLITVVQEQSIIVSAADVANVAVLWVTSIGLGYLMQILGIPPLLGSLIAGILLQNAFSGFEVSPRFGEFVETLGLCVILLISSTEIDMHSVASCGGVSLRLTFLPGLVEAFVCGAATHWIFDMPIALALSLGFILAAVSPAIVVPGMTELQRLGYGVQKGIPSLLLAACAFDDIVAITGFTISVGIALDQSDNLALSAFIHGPVAIFLGVVSGMISGFLLGVTRYCPRDWQRFAIALELGLLMTFGYKSVGLDGSGAIGALLMCVCAKMIWENKRVITYTQCSGTEYIHKIGMNINIVWDIVVRPLLFGSIGASFDLDTMQADSVLKGCAIVIIGLFFRMPTAFMSSLGAGLNANEKLFITAAWCPKATVQAALCSLPLNMIRNSVNSQSSTWLEWGSFIQSTAILAIMITAPMGLMAIQFLGPYLLSSDRKALMSST